MWTALGYGIAGLGALLAFLAYSLLARPRIDRVPVYVFMAFSLLVICLGLGSEVLKYHYDSQGKDYELVKNQLETRNKEINADAKLISDEISKLQAIVTAGRDHGKAAADNYSNSSGCLMNGNYARGDGDNALTQIERLRGKVSKLITQ